MKAQHVVRVRPTLAVLAATVALGAVASPAHAEVRVGGGPTIHDLSAQGDRTARVDRRAAAFRARYQLQLNPAHKLLGT